MRDEQVLVNTTSKILTLTARSGSTGQFITDAVAGDFSGHWGIAGGTTAALSFSVGSEGDSYSSGKLCPRGEGSYDWHVPNSLLTTLGQVTAVISVTDAIDIKIEFQIVAINREDGVRGGMTSLPNAEADAAGGLPISDVGGLSLDEVKASTDKLTDARVAVLTDWIDGGRLDVLLDAKSTHSASDVWTSTTRTLSAFAFAVTVGTNSDKTGYSLTSGERSTLAGVIDLALINTGDGADFVGALADAIAADWVQGDASPLAIVAALKADAQWSNLVTMQTNITSILEDTDDLQSNQGDWATATGFSTHNAAAVLAAFGTGSDLTSLVTATGFATPTNITSATGIVLSVSHILGQSFHAWRLLIRRH